MAAKRSKKAGRKGHSTVPSLNFALPATSSAVDPPSSSASATTRQRRAKRGSLSSQSSVTTSIFSEESDASTTGTSPSASVVVRHKKGWSSAQQLTRPSPAHIDPHAPLTAEPPDSRVVVHQKPHRSFDQDPDWIPHPADAHCLKHGEFGFDEHDEYRWTSAYRPPTQLVDQQHARESSVIEVPVDCVMHDDCEDPSYWVYFSTYFSYLILICFGHLRDFFGKRFARKYFHHLMPHDGYAALNSDFDSFYTRRLKARLDDCFARPVTGVAGRTITLLDRTSTDNCFSFGFTGTTTQALNISSYNYLGFAQSRGGCADSVERCIDMYGTSTGGSRQDVGTHILHVEAERLVARFLGTESAILISQGFATNSTTLPAIVSKGCLIISDEFNHSSIRFGARLSGAMIKQYKHNDMKDLEKLLREVISQGQPRTHRPWKKILIIVEGIYSMEGTIVNLPALLALKQQYKFYLYVDEAHSVGALGPRGRGVCDYFGVDPQQVDVLMGTLTKSFGASGGYIAGSEVLISKLRLHNHSSVYAESMSPPVIQQIVSSMSSIMGLECLDVVPALRHRLDSKLIDGREGKERLKRLAFNGRYLATGLRKLGFIVYGNRDSPIVPLLIFHPGKMHLFSRLMLERYSIVVVVVAYPATPLVSSRVRFCLSAAHTKQDIDRLLIATYDVGKSLGLLTGGNVNERMKLEDVISQAVELVAEA